MADYNVSAADSASFADLAPLYWTVYASDSFIGSDITYHQQVGVICSASDSATLSDAAGFSQDHGRVRRGDFVTLEFTAPSLPDRPPVAVILDSNNIQIAAIMMPLLLGSQSTFSLQVQISTAYAVGTFQVFYDYVIDGSASMQQGQFEVIAGGDAGGAVISMYSVDRPEIRSFIVQLDSGVLVLGRSPTV